MSNKVAENDCYRVYARDSRTGKFVSSSSSKEKDEAVVVGRHPKRASKASRKVIRDTGTKYRKVLERLAKR